MATRDQTLNVIMTAESGGKNVYNYRYTENPNYYTASGYFQIVNSTWRSTAPGAGVDISQYPTAISAPYDVQRQVAGKLLDTQGTAPWSNYNPAIAPKLAALDRGESVSLNEGPADGGNGQPASLVNSGGTTPTGTTPTGTTPANTYPGTGAEGLADNSAATAAAGMPGQAPGIYGGIQEFGLTAGLAQGIGGWITNAEKTAGGWVAGIETGVGNAFKGAFSAVLDTAANLFTRFGLILLGIVVIALALWRLMDPGGEKAKAVVRSFGQARGVPA